MKITAICEPNFRSYLLGIFGKHIDSDMVLETVYEQKPRIEISTHILQKLKQSEHDGILLAIHHNHCLSKLLTALHDEGISKVYVIRLFALDQKADFISGSGFNPSCVDKIPEANERPYLVHLETHVCDHCNLNCKACNNFSPFVKEPHMTNPVQFEKDMRRLSKLFSNIGRLFLLGGEPLLEPELCCEMVQIARCYFPNAELRVLTNATLIPQMAPAFWQCLKEHNVILHISVYPPVVKQVPAIEEILLANHITYFLARKVTEFVKAWTLFPFEDKTYNNERCGSAGCHYLQEGMLSKCPDGILIGNMASVLGVTPDVLKASDSLSISDDISGWDINRKLDEPCELCKKCSMRRMSHIQWEPTGSSANPSDWLIENRLEYENRMLNEQLRKMTRAKEQATIVSQKEKDARKKVEIECQKEKSERQKAEAEQQKIKENHQREILVKDFEVAKISGELLKKDGELQKAIRDIADLRVKHEREVQLVQDTNKRLLDLQMRYDAMNRSLSFQVGRAVTWLPRKIYGMVRCLRENGVIHMIKLLLKKVAKKIFPSSFVHLNQVFLRTVMAGFKIYSEIIHQYGEDVVILGCAPKGTGDYYLCGMYLKAWMVKHNYTNYTFLTLKGSQEQVTLLFQVYRGHTYSVTPQDTYDLRDFRGFLGEKKQNFFYLDHQYPFITNKMCCLRTKELMGLHGLTILDFYKYFGYELYEGASLELPLFNAENSVEYFRKGQFKKGRTVLLSPYSTSNIGNLPTNKFWIKIAEYFLNNEYTVCTNCAGSEQPIPGTRKICLPYKDSVPFLNLAGYFIGVRSGLCDIISTSICRKIVIHTYKNRFWPNGNSIAYTGLNNMMLCNDAIEMEYHGSDDDENLINEIISYIVNVDK